MYRNASNMDLTIHLIVYGAFITGSSGFLFGPRNKSSTVTTQSTVETTVSPVKDEEPFDLVKAEAGAIAGVVFGVLLSAVFISIAGIIYIKRKRERDREYMRRATLHRMSKESAGVYTDTTVDTNLLPSEPNNERSRSKRKDPNIYGDSSEDEL